MAEGHEALVGETVTGGKEDDLGLNYLAWAAPRRVLFQCWANHTNKARKTPKPMYLTLPPSLTNLPLQFPNPMWLPAGGDAEREP